MSKYEISYIDSDGKEVTEEIVFNPREHAIGTDEIEWIKDIAHTLANKGWYSIEKEVIDPEHIKGSYWVKV